MRSYLDIRGCQQDFNVAYELIAPELGGRKITYQHLKCDFLYDGDDPKLEGIYMIHPEFLDSEGKPLPDDLPVPLKGEASMWILSQETTIRAIHRNRIKVGTKGYFVEGSRIIGTVTVTEIVGLLDVELAIKRSESVIKYK